MAFGGPAAVIHRQAHPARVAVAAAHSGPRFEPCPCDHPVCRPLCFQNAASGGPASMINPQTHLPALGTGRSDDAELVSLTL